MISSDLLKTGFPIVSKVQSSVLFVIPGSEGSKGDIPTPNILADPSHLNDKQFLIKYKIYETVFLTSVDPC